jgi:hypothetical protein
MITGSIFVGLTKVTRDNWSIHGGDDLSQVYGLGFASQDVTAPHASFGANQTSPLERQEDLFEVGLGKAGAFSNVSNRGRGFAAAMQGKTQQGTACVVTPGRDLHAFKVTLKRSGIRI